MKTIRFNSTVLPVIAAVSFFGQLFLSGSAYAQQSALINGVQEPYTLIDAQYDYGFQQQAVRVTGTAGYASVPYTATLVQPAYFTLEAFVKMEASGGGSNIIAARRGSAGQDWQWWCNTSGTVIFNGFSASGAPVGTVTSTRTLSLNQWHHVCISVDSTWVVSIYIDGDMDTQVTLTGSVNTSASSAIPIYVAGSGIAGRVFPGVVGDVRFYSGVVSSQRLAEAKVMLGTDAFGSIAHQFALINGVQQPLTLVSALYDTGFQDQAIRVTGSTGYAAVPFTSTLVEPASFTFEALVKMDTGGTGSGMIAARRGATGQDWQLYCNTYGTVIFNGFAASDSPVGTLTTTQKLNLGEWYHICVSVDAAQIATIYIDGTPAVTGTLTGPVNSSTSSAIQLQVAGSGIAGRIFPGLVGDARLYAGVVSAARLLEAQTLTHPWKQTIARNLVMGFEQEGAWCTAPVGLLDVMSEGILQSAKPLIGQDYYIAAVPFYDLACGATLDTTRFVEGTCSLLWNNHPQYPTLACWKVDTDWSAYQTVGFSIYSAVATGELVTLAVLSDSSVTPAKDYYTYTFAIDWTGWKTVTIPLASFDSLNSPVGWSKVDGVYFFTKAFHCLPNPQTSLNLDAMVLGTTYVAPTVAKVAPPSIWGNLNDQQDQLVSLNHTYPELDVTPDPTKPIVHQRYFQTERSLYGYFPCFDPGYVSFDPQGRAYLRSTLSIDRLTTSGTTWQRFDVHQTLVNWAISLESGWGGVSNQAFEDHTVRFDSNGCAYMTADITLLNASGVAVGNQQMALLLYSNDGMQTWKVYRLPGKYAVMEKVDGHNTDCLSRPPVILLGNNKGCGSNDPSGFIVVPIKNADGTLTIPAPVKFGDYTVGPPYNGGAANTIITHGDTVYIVYGWLPDPYWQAHDPNWQSTMPYIPGNAPGMNMSFTVSGTQTVGYSKNGVPTYVVTYNITTGAVSAPVYVGSGFSGMDNHIWPAITLDSQGYLHVLINGHNSPMVYTKSLSPYDISAWTNPIYIQASTQPGNTYATLACDANDTLHSVVRSTTGCYNFRMTYFRKKAGADWEAEKDLVVPFKGMYWEWEQKMGYDPVRNRLFLTYCSAPAGMQLVRDSYEFLVFDRPDQETTLCANSGQAFTANNPGPPLPDGFTAPMYLPCNSEWIVILSDDGGTTWRIATTPDFIQ